MTTDIQPTEQLDNLDATVDAESSSTPSAESVGTEIIDKARVLDSLATGEFRSIDYPGRSDVWASFQRILRNDDAKTSLPFAKCKQCGGIFATGGRNSTSSLRSHQQKHARTLEAERLLQVQNAARADVSPQIKTDSARELLLWFTQNLRPDHTAADSGLACVLQRAIDIGRDKALAGDGRPLAGDVFPKSHNSVAKHASAMHTAATHFIAEDVKLLAAHGGGITSDGWTSRTGISFETITMLTLDDSWKLIRQVLATVPIPPGTCEDHVFLFSTVRDTILNRYGVDINSIREKLIFTLDGASSLQLAFQDFEKVLCAPHVLNTVLRHLFKKENLDRHVMQPVRQQLKACSATVSFFSRSKSKAELATTPKASVDTRFNSKLRTMTSIEGQLDDIKAILCRKKKRALAERLDGDVLRHLIAFLSPFKEATDDLEQSRAGTLSLVCDARRELLQSCAPAACDAEFIKALKTDARRLIKEKMKISDHHRVAFVLDPREKDTLLHDLEFAHIGEKLQELMRTHDPTTDETMSFADSNAPPVSKRPKVGRLEERRQDRYNQRRGVATLSVEDEYDAYLGDKRQVNGDSSDWWAANFRKYPRLGAVSRLYHGAQASQCDSERNQSTAGLIVTDRRTRLLPSRVDGALCAKSFMDRDPENRARILRHMRSTTLADTGTSVDATGDAAEETVAAGVGELITSSSTEAVVNGGVLFESADVDAFDDVSTDEDV